MTIDSMWDERFSADEYAYGTLPNDFLREQVSTLQLGTVLSLAEGEGRNAVFLAQKGFKVTAVDGSLAGIKKAKNLAKTLNLDITFIHTDLCEYDLGRQRWDNIISIFAPFTESDRTVLHEKVCTALKPNGVYLLEAYHPNQIAFGTGGGNDPSTMPTAVQLEHELNKLEPKLLIEKERLIHEGKFHNGKSAVTQLIAQKHK